MARGRLRLQLEASAAVGDAKDIVRYDPATGNRVVLVSAADLSPVEGEDPLSIDDYLWSDDGTQLLVFTNPTKVWRSNTRGWHPTGGGEIMSEAPFIFRPPHNATMRRMAEIGAARSK